MGPSLRQSIIHSVIDPAIGPARQSVTYRVYGCRRADFGGVKQGTQP